MLDPVAHVICKSDVFFVFGKNKDMKISSAFYPV
jgi:hypothetical protein